MKKIITILSVFLFTVAAYGQESATDGQESATDRLDFHADLQTNHLWRGIFVSDIPIISADINFALDKKHNLKLGIWGGMGIADHKNEHYGEINYYLNYDNGKFGIGVWDVFNYTGRVKGTKDHDIWNYNRKTTGHRLDLRGYVVFSEQVPLKLEYGTSFYGEDRNLKGDQRFSTYAGLSYPVVKNEKITLEAFCGGAVGITGDSHFYGNGKHDFDIVNVGLTASKDVPVLGYKLPVSASVVWNPSVREARVQVIASLF